MNEKVNKARRDKIWFVVLLGLAVIFLAPILLIFINSFKGKLYISEDLFSLPNSTTFVGLDNYIRGIETVNFLVCIWLFRLDYCFISWDHRSINIHDSVVYCPR